MGVLSAPYSYLPPASLTADNIAAQLSTPPDEQNSPTPSSSDLR